MLHKGGELVVVHLLGVGRQAILLLRGAEASCNHEQAIIRLIMLDSIVVMNMGNIAQSRNRTHISFIPS